MINKHLGFALTLIALLLFVPGIIYPMFSLNMELKAQLSQSILTSPIVNKELSILATVEELWRDERLLVAMLIFAFSILIPVIKTALVCLAYWRKNTEIEQKIMKFISSIGKWSMADVFVVAVFLAILSTNHAETQDTQQFAIFGFKLDLLISSETLSNVGSGFYFFTAYCLLSLLGSHLYQKTVTN
ncbi:Paraquat-inducible protein A [Saccharobesus litoralis]|uniref:Paraquat-inducible protein A n=1 Tax=Saccharobesus litoralis TaxID=2172099 RepID=A0A2S0VLU3_9ALTE|nr:paraquat-inducible protein A [Saccharobesus litoralis]AWB65187.1 Paraquat-inducible protein A [Saccharobesus litoralis]